ncbi:unnamed protein product [Meloidogyne enterolobii]|uniref:Uncharacterized protein n=1 Tax=Meloidogyne enterolobii TaxID=390850 RepID=A0ACB0ZLE5_MELEN
MAIPLASVSKMKGFPNRGVARIGALVNLFFISSRILSCFSVQSLVDSFLVRS